LCTLIFNTSIFGYPSSMPYVIMYLYQTFFFNFWPPYFHTSPLTPLKFGDFLLCDVLKLFYESSILIH
jgi:hypothetical protein